MNTKNDFCEIVSMSSRFNWFLLVFIFFGNISHQAQAAEHNTAIVDMGVTCNEHGAVLEIKGGPLRGRTVYLGKDGDAASPGVGEGRWWTAASGYVIQLSDESWRFNGDPPCY